MKGGYAGRILHVDLSSGRTEIMPLDPSWAREWIGGLGFGTSIFLDRVLRGDGEGKLPDPLSPDNPFVLMTGPLTGARMDAVARWTVGARSPLTGFWGEANVGGHFGARLKAAGWDGLVIEGKAPSPCYLRIVEDSVTLENAETYWGLDTYSTEEKLLAAESAISNAESGPGSSSRGEVVSIGPAGENLVRFAALVHRPAYKMYPEYLRENGYEEYLL